MKQFQIKKGNLQKDLQFFKFQGITELFTQKEGKVESEILNMEEVHWKILSLMGEEYENIYL
jgi:transposase